MAVILASMFGVLSGVIGVLLGGAKTYGEDYVLGILVTKTFWKCLDYPKAAFLCVRACVVFFQQVRLFRSQARRFEQINLAMTNDGVRILHEQAAAEGGERDGRTGRREERPPD